MPRGFTVQEAKDLLARHGAIRDLTAQSLALPAAFREDVANAAEELVASEVLKTLRGVPVEELSRELPGIRVKTLRDAGFYTVGDLATATVHRITLVKGISREGAQAIRGVVDRMTAQARADMKIRLSADDKNRAATKLVKALLQVRRMGPFAAELKKLQRESAQWLEPCEADLQPVFSGTLKWMFAGRQKKTAAAQAYEFLLEQAEGSYGQRFEELTAGVEAQVRMTGAEAWKEFEKDPVPFFNTLEEIAPGVLGTDDSLYGLPEDLAQEIANETYYPNGLLCELRRYQQWGVKYILHQGRVLLGDEMGLGKTVQAIAAMVSMANTGGAYFAVVCPAAVLTNWCREIASKSRLRVVRVHGPGRGAAFAEWLQRGGVAVTTYETAGTLPWPEQMPLSMLVADEAHYIKNPEARRSQNVMKLCGKAQRVLFLTGTALENRVSEMVSLIRILQPEVAKSVEGMEFLAAAPQFRKLVAPVYYRRRREDVLTELPDLVENQEWCDLTKEETKRYETAVLAKDYTDIRRVSFNLPDLARSSKAQRMAELIAQAKEDNRKVIVFSFYLDTIRAVVDFLGDAACGPITGSVPAARRQEILDEFGRAPAGTVLVSQITSGGTGLNIQAASVVILCEPQFKPSVENQAISRAYRMGQTRAVFVFRLLADETVDERITEILDRKQKLFDAFADKSEAAEKTLEIDDSTFGDIVREEIERIKARNEAEEAGS